MSDPSVPDQVDLLGIFGHLDDRSGEARRVGQGLKEPLEEDFDLSDAGGGRELLRAVIEGL